MLPLGEAPASPAPPFSPSKDVWLSLLLFAALTLLMTWPLARKAATHATAHPDTYLHLWGLTWVCHQSATHPLALYESSMYFPQKHSLAYTESLLPQAALAAPLRLLGGGPLLAYNWALLLTFPLSGWSAYLLGRELTRERLGGLVAGLGYAFNTFRWNHIIHLGVLSVEWLPLVILFLLRSLRAPTPRNLALLYASVIAQALSSGYYTVLVGFTILAVLVSTVALWRWGTMTAIGACLLAAALTVLAATWPYLTIRKHSRDASRSLGQVVAWSAHPSSYLDPGSNEPTSLGTPASWLALHVARTSREALYPGALVLLLAPLGAALGWRKPATWTCLALAATGLALSLGPLPHVLGHEHVGPFFLLRKLPVVDMVRVPSRLGILTILALDLLAAIGLTGVLSTASSAIRAAAGIGLGVLFLVDLYPTWLPELVQPLPQPPRTVEWLSDAKPGPVLELPTTLHLPDSHDALYMVWSTHHWHPMVNGNGSFRPGEAEAIATVGNGFPNPAAVSILRKNGVRYVVLHLDLMTPARRRHIERYALPKGVVLAAEFGDDEIYTVD
jgi:hypothetical protein